MQKQDIVILGYYLVHWEDAESLALSSMKIIRGCKQGTLLCKAYNYNYMFGAGPTWTSAYFILRYLICCLFLYRCFAFLVTCTLV